MTWHIVVITLFILLALLYAQERHYIYLEAKRQAEHDIGLDTDISELRDEFQEYKERVDVLTLKAGFKL